MEDLVTAKTGIVPPRPFYGVKNPSYRIENTAQKKKGEAPGGKKPVEGIKGDNRQPSHDQIDAGSQPTGRVDPE